MLLVKTYIATSTIPNAGMGCFANEIILKGTKIWELNPILDRVYTEHNIRMMTDLEAEFVRIYSYKHNGLYFLCVDNARFFNHSETNFNTIDPSDEYATYAARNINIGEEIISNYLSFGITDDDKKFNISL